MTEVLLQGVQCSIPDAPKKIEWQKFKPKDQYFRRTTIPAFMNTVIRDEDWTLCNFIEGKKIPLTKAQEDFILLEVDRCIDGFWFMRKGQPCWITGKYYYFLNYWTTEDGAGYSSITKKIEYREIDREFFIFYDNSYDHPIIDGIVRGKKVREGATTQGTCISAHTAAFFSDQNCGTLSNKGDNAGSTFTSMITKGFYDSPIWLQPRYDNKENAAKKLSFVLPRTKKEGNITTTKREGNNSTISWERTSTSAYVNARISYMLIDESGRWEELNVYDYWNNVLKDRIRRGASKTGFVYMPTAVNQPNKGGRNFQKLWHGSNQYGVNGVRTKTGLVKWFVPAWYGYSGFIDRYGDSVVDPPDAETLAYLIEKQAALPKKERVPTEDLMLGAKKYLQRQREALSGDDEALSAHKRNYPFVEADMFDFGELFNPFDQEKLKYQLQWCKDNPTQAYWRRGRLVPYEYLDDGTPQFNIRFHDDPHGLWFISEMPVQPNAFSIDDNRIVRPLAKHLYGGGMDTYRFDQTKELGSKAAICIGSKMDISKPEGQEGGELVAFWMGRLKLTELVWREMLMAELFYGCSITAERDATQEYIKYHQNKIKNLLDANCMPMLGKKPDAAIDANRKVRSNEQVEYGAASADKFVFAKQIELAVIYIYKYYWKIKLILLLEQLIDFDPDERTKFDAAIGFFMMLLNITGDFRQQKQENKKRERLVEEFTLGGGLKGFEGFAPFAQSD